MVSNYPAGGRANVRFHVVKLHLLGTEDYATRTHRRRETLHTPFPTFQRFPNGASKPKLRQKATIVATDFICFVVVLFFFFYKPLCRELTGH